MFLCILENLIDFCDRHPLKPQNLCFVMQKLQIAFYLVIVEWFDLDRHEKLLFYKLYCQQIEKKEIGNSEFFDEEEKEISTIKHQLNCKRELLKPIN